MCSGLTYGQVDDLSCEPFCLSSETICTCTVTGAILAWEVIDASDTTIGSTVLNTKDLNSSPLIGAPAFEVILTSSTGGTLTAMLTFTTLSEYEGYTIECDVDGNPLIVTISIPGIEVITTSHVEVVVLTELYAW